MNGRGSPPDSSIRSAFEVRAGTLGYLRLFRRRACYQDTLQPRWCSQQRCCSSWWQQWACRAPLRSLNLESWCASCQVNTINVWNGAFGALMACSHTGSARRGAGHACIDGMDALISKPVVRSSYAMRWFLSSVTATSSDSHACMAPIHHANQECATGIP